MDRLTAVILAAGEAKRMRSRQPKVLHPLCGRPLIAYALRTARALADRTVVVAGPNADDVRVAAGDGVTFVEQRERLGAGLPERVRSEEHTSELQSRPHLVCRLLLAKKKSATRLASCA